jgi:hypothetical protein
LKFGITNITGNGIENKQFVLCKVVLSQESMKTSKRQFETSHSEHTKKDM